MNKTMRRMWGPAPYEQSREHEGHALYLNLQVLQRKKKKEKKEKKKKKKRQKRG